MRSYQDLETWQRAMDCVVACYAVARQLPTHERFGIAGQLQRAAVSVPANIAEGHSRESQREFARYLTIARASLTEAETHLVLIQRLEYVTPNHLQPALAICSEVNRLLRGLLRSVRKPNSGR